MRQRPPSCPEKHLDHVNTYSGALGGKYQGQQAAEHAIGFRVKVEGGTFTQMTISPEHLKEQTQTRNPLSDPSMEEWLKELDTLMADPPNDN